MASAGDASGENSNDLRWKHREIHTFLALVTSFSQGMLRARTCIRVGLSGRSHMEYRNIRNHRIRERINIELELKDGDRVEAQRWASRSICEWELVNGVFRIRDSGILLERVSAESVHDLERREPIYPRILTAESLIFFAKKLSHESKIRADSFCVEDVCVDFDEQNLLRKTSSIPLLALF